MFKVKEACTESATHSRIGGHFADDGTSEDLNSGRAGQASSV